MAKRRMRWLKAPNNKLIGVVLYAGLKDRLNVGFCVCRLLRLLYDNQEHRVDRIVVRRYGGKENRHKGYNGDIIALNDRRTFINPPGETARGIIVGKKIFDIDEYVTARLAKPKEISVAKSNKLNANVIEIGDTVIDKQKITGVVLAVDAKKAEVTYQGPGNAKYIEDPAKLKLKKKGPGLPAPVVEPPAKPTRTRKTKVVTSDDVVTEVVTTPAVTTQPVQTPWEKRCSDLAQQMGTKMEKICEDILRVIDWDAVLKDDKTATEARETFALHEATVEGSMRAMGMHPACGRIDEMCTRSFGSVDKKEWQGVVLAARKIDAQKALYLQKLIEAGIRMHASPLWQKLLAKETGKRKPAPAPVVPPVELKPLPSIELDATDDGYFS